MYNIHIMLNLFYFTLIMGFNYFISTHMTHELRLIKKVGILLCYTTFIYNLY